MPNDGYVIQYETITATAISNGSVTIFDYTLPNNVDARINTICVIQRNNTSTDVYSYCLESLAIKKDGYNSGYVSFFSGENLTGACNPVGTATAAKVAIQASNYNVRWYTTNSGSNTFRFAIFAHIYMTNNN